MKKLFLLFTVLSFIILGCASSSSAVKPEEIPSVDYSLVGRDDSVILAYIDPSLLLGKPMVVKISEWLTFTVWANPVNYSFDYSSEKIINYHRSLAGNYHESGQFSIENGTYTLQVTAVRGATGLSDELSGRTVALPFKTDLKDVAVLYKIRLATDEEKKAAFIGLGNEVYTLEEVSRTKLR